MMKQLLHSLLRNAKAVLVEPENDADDTYVSPSWSTPDEEQDNFVFYNAWDEGIIDFEDAEVYYEQGVFTVKGQGRITPLFPKGG